MGVVGQNAVRLDGREKVTGRALYVDDIVMPGMWHGVAVRTTIPSGKVLSVVFDPRFNWKKVVVADRHDIPGRNVVTMIEEDMPLLVHDEIRHIGEAIVLIAAPTKKMAEDARRHVEIRYEEWQPVLTIEDSKAKKRVIHGSDNVISRYKIDKGDVSAGFKDSDAIVEGVYRTGAQEQAYIEPQGIIASPGKGGGVDLVGSMQCPFYILKALERLLGMSETKLSVKQATVGGAFGGKEDYPSVLAGYASVLALKAKRPVKMIYDRNEDMNVTTKRHPSVVRHRTGVKKNGMLVAMDIGIELDAGAYTTLTPVVLSRGFLHSAGPYRCPNVRIAGAAFATNAPPNGAFRGFGAPQTLFAVEAHMDKIAEEIGMSPLELRRINCLKVGDEMATGQILKESVGALECLEKAAAASGFERKWRASLPLCKGESEGIEVRSTLPDPPLQREGTVRGIGISLFMHGGGFTGSGEAKMKGKAGIRLERDGKLTVLTGCTEMGQGAHTVLPQIVAECLGVPLSCVRVETPDTSKVPDSGPTVASRVTMVIGKVLCVCAEEMKRRLSEAAGRDHGDFRSLAGSFLKKRGPLTIIEAYEPTPGIHWDDTTYHGDAYAAYSWGCDVAEVEVDKDTFEIKVERMYMAHDVGRAVNPQMVEGQIEGGTLQALGWALMEDNRYDGGKLLNNRFQTYIIPTTMDTPFLELITVEHPFSHGPLGAKGVGELPHDGAAPAVVNAIANATGIRISEIPATPERLFEECKKKHFRSS